MIKICDRTLSCLDDFSPTAEQLFKLITLLFYCDADCLELSEKAYQILGGRPKFGSYILRIDAPEKAERYPELDQFICERNADERRHVYAELFINDVRDSNLMMQHSGDSMLRLTGLDDLYRRPVESSLAYIKSFLPKKTEFCPGNALSCAVAAGMEWIHGACGDTLVTSFGGIGGFAPFEQVLISLRQLFRRHPQTKYDCLPQIRDMMAEITKQELPVCNPITGDGIFTVESGIHVSGILKHPKCYEPFSPESVGNSRKFMYGKFSGSASIKYKLEELGVCATEHEIQEMTLQVKAVSEQNNRSLSDEELRSLIILVKSGGQAT